MDLEPAQPSRGAVCAAHDGAQAIATCARCGNFVCPLCLDPLSPLPEHCAACRAREGGAIAWERDDGRSWFARWWQTSRDVVFRPRDTFENVRPGRVGAAVGYVSVTGALMGLLLSALLGAAVAVLAAAGLFGDLLETSDVSLAAAVGIVLGVLLSYPLLFVLGMLLSVALRTLVYHGAVALLGGRGGFAASLWTVSYVHGIYLAQLPLAVVQQVPLIGPFIGLAGYLAIEVFVGVQLTRTAERYHGLTGARAALAGWSMFFLSVVFVGSCCVLGFIFAFSRAL